MKTKEWVLKTTEKEEIQIPSGVKYGCLQNAGNCDLWIGEFCLEPDEKTPVVQFEKEEKIDVHCSTNELGGFLQGIFW